MFLSRILAFVSGEDKPDVSISASLPAIRNMSDDDDFVRDKMFMFQQQKGERPYCDTFVREWADIRVKITRFRSPKFGGHLSSRAFCNACGMHVAPSAAIDQEAVIYKYNYFLNNALLQHDSVGCIFSPFLIHI